MYPCFVSPRDKRKNIWQLNNGYGRHRKSNTLCYGFILAAFIFSVFITIVNFAKLKGSLNIRVLQYLRAAQSCKLCTVLLIKATMDVNLFMARLLTFNNLILFNDKFSKSQSQVMGIEMNLKSNTCVKEAIIYYSS